MGEHLPCKQGVKSSNLSVSTGHSFVTISNLKTSYSRDNDFKKILKYQDIRELTNQEFLLNKQKISKLHILRLNNKERRVDALALRADERRDKLRKALGSCK